VGVVHLHRGDQPFTADNLAVLRVWCDQAAPWLDQLRRHGVWFGARWQIRGRTVLGRLWGVEDAWLKLGVVLGALVLAGAIFGGRMFRVDAPFILRSASQAFIPAPFDGFILSVTREIGDPVEADGVLLALDESVLRQREAGLLADIARYRGEAERAESAGRFAEMRIAQAQGRQAAAELEVVRYQVKRAMLRAPFAGTVMEGRHRERLGAAVKQGELLFRVARTDRVYAEIDVDERDVQELREGARGEIAFTSRPDESFPLRVVRIEPAGTTKNAANVFVVRAELPGAARAWWRPGMTGVAKIEAGRRSYLWIATHRLVDFLRLKLWWW
jgi:multidrug resistance efflux pump